MAFQFETTIDKRHKLIITRISGFASTMEEYLKWELSFRKSWEENFGDEKVRLLRDHRGFKLFGPEILERVKKLRDDTRDNLIATAAVVDSAIAKVQLKRISEDSGYEEIERIFTDVDEAIAWLKSQ